MAPTTTGSLGDSLDTIVASARLFAEFDPVVPRTVDRQRLPMGTGLDWLENLVGQMTATTVTETTILENPQEHVDTQFSVTPVTSAITTIITRKTMRRISKRVVPMLSRTAGLAMSRKLDTDGISQFSNFSNTLAGTGVTLLSGHIGAGVTQILGNTTETGQGQGEIFAVVHPFGKHDIESEIEAGVGTYTIPVGLTAKVYERGFSGTVRGANLFTDGNITIDSTPDARGAVYARNAIVLVEDGETRRFTKFLPERGGGADQMFIYHDYAYGERRDVWGSGLLHDATAPTS